MEDQIPRRIEPECMMVLCDIRDRDRFIKYVKDGFIPYKIEGDDIFFTEECAIDFLCHNWDDKPNTLRELDEYCDVGNDWDLIEEEASQYDFAEELYGVIKGKSNNNSQKTKKEKDHCIICGDKAYSKDVCSKHYHKIRYHYDEVTVENAKKLEKEHLGGKWSQNYNQCRDCGTTARPHHARGYCTRCYQNN